MVYKFYFIKTFHTVSWIEQKLYEIGCASPQNCIKVIKDRSGRETNRTVAFLDEQVYTHMLSHQRTDLLIEPFQVPQAWHPLATSTYNFCIPFPPTSEIEIGAGNRGTLMRDQFFIDQIRRKLEPFIAHGALPFDGFKINIPVISRSQNQTKAIAFLMFHPSISRDVLSIIRYMIDETFWDDRKIFRCFWAHQSKRNREE